MGGSMTTERYSRSKDNFDTAAEAWADIEERSERVESFEQYVDRDHNGSEWAFIVEVDR